MPATTSSAAETRPFVSFSDLPVVITGAGDYVTRDGRRVTIHDTDGKGTFFARGAIWREFRGKLRPKGFDIWHASGRFKALGESKADIVGVWVETTPAA